MISARSHSRRGTILILVSGIAVMLLAMATAFLMRMRADAQESALVVREAQCRIMLYAALNYIQESSRLGWVDPGTGEPREAYGWNDVRDGSAGPKGHDLSSLYQPGSWPAEGTAVRQSTHVMTQPPFAIQPLWAPNAVTDFGADRTTVASFAELDPQPVATSWDGGSADDGSFLRGIATPRSESMGRSWFRIYRERREDHDGDGTPAYDNVDLGDHHAVFVVTCGAGGTLGYRDVASLPPSESMGAWMFEQMREQERILWFRVAWSPALGDFTLKTFRSDDASAGWDEEYVPNVSKKPRAFFGTISWIERLEHEPPNW